MDSRLASLIVLVLCLTLGSSAAVVAVTWDVAADFSETANPNAPWAFGYTSGATFTAFPSIGDWYAGYHSGGSIYAWYDYFSFPVVGHSHTGSVVTIWGRCLPLLPSMVAVCPGDAPTGRDVPAVVSFTAPWSAVYTISAQFTQLDWSSAAGVAVYTSGGSVNWTGALTGQGTSASFAQAISLAEGESLFLEVNKGSDGSNMYDTIGLTASLTAIPEPSAILVLLSGLGSGALVLRRMRK